MAPTNQEREESTGVIVAAPDELRLTRAPDVILKEAQKAAAALKDVLDKKPRKVIMGGEQYLEFEDWQTLGRFYGVTAKEVGEATFVEFGGIKGFRASAVAVRSDGVEISAATAYCLTDEPRWVSRPKYDKGEHVGEEPVPVFQLASMAQTRANAKALRNVLSWVAVLAGYRPTPAEEIDAMPVAKVHTAPTPTAGADLRVQRVSVKTGRSAQGRPWTRYLVEFSDGRTASTLDPDMGRLAQEYERDQSACVAGFNKSGAYVNLTELARSQGASSTSPAPPEPTPALVQEKPAKAELTPAPTSKPKPVIVETFTTAMFAVTRVVDLGGAPKRYGIETKELGVDQWVITADRETARSALRAKLDQQHVELTFHAGAAPGERILDVLKVVSEAALDAEMV